MKTHLLNGKDTAPLFFTLTLLSATFFSVGCGYSPAPSSDLNTSSSEKSSVASAPLAATPGDSTVYAMAAAGSNDSILVYLRLPYEGADPDTVDILDALRRHHIFGRPAVGDNVAIVLNDSDRTVAECIITMQQLAGQWNYEVLPVLKRHLGDGPLPERLQNMLKQKREHGMVIKLSGEMFSIGAHARQADEQLPVVYPRSKDYGRWAIFNGRLVLSEVERDTAGTARTIGTDTACFVRMTRDTLVLRFHDAVRTFYRKAEKSQ